MIFKIDKELVEDYDAKIVINGEEYLLKEVGNCATFTLEGIERGENNA